MTQLSQSNPYDIYQGHQRFLIRDEQHQIWIAGNNSNGALGIDHKDMFCLDFALIDTDKNIKIISNGKFAQHTIYMKLEKHNDKTKPSEKVQVFYGFGRNSSYQLCNEQLQNRQYRKTQHLGQLLPSNVSIIAIECGDSHSLFLGAAGNIYACGSNRFHQCGVDNYIDDDEERDDEDCAANECVMDYTQNPETWKLSSLARVGGKLEGIKIKEFLLGIIIIYAYLRMIDYGYSAVIGIVN